jgi:hypothetical protein
MWANDSQNCNVSANSANPPPNVLLALNQPMTKPRAYGEQYHALA